MQSIRNSSEELYDLILFLQDVSSNNYGPAMQRFINIRAKYRNNILAQSYIQKISNQVGLNKKKVDKPKTSSDVTNPFEGHGELIK